MREDMCGADLSPALASRRCGGIQQGDGKHLFRSCYVINWHPCLRGLFCTVKLTMFTPLWTRQPFFFYSRHICIVVLLGGDFALPVQAQLWLLHHKGRHSSTLGSRLGMLLCFVWYVASFPTQEPSCPKDHVSCSGGAWPEIQMLKLLVAICFKTLSLQAPDLKKI